MINSKSKYIFIATNTFSIVYFIAFINKHKIHNYIFIINNSNNFFNNGGYDKLFNKNHIPCIIIDGEENIRSFPYSIKDIYIKNIIIKKKTQKYKGYKIITGHDHIITDQLILNTLSKNNQIYGIINNNITSNKKYNFSNFLYKFIYLFFKINKFKNLGYQYNYIFRYSYKNINKNILIEKINLLKLLFNEILKSLNNIQSNKNIIFLSQNIIDEYGIEPNVFTEKLSIIEKYYKNLGYDFYIKPHPMENTFYYENTFKLIDKSIPSELFDIYFGNKDTIYITFFSTVINNLQFGKKYLIGDIGFGKNEISIINLLHKKFNIPFLNIPKK